MMLQIPPALARSTLDAAVSNQSIRIGSKETKMPPSVAPEPRTGRSRALVKTQTGASPETATNAAANSSSNTALSEADHRHAIIAEAAYLRAQQRHFEPGHDVEDWLAAESAFNLQRAAVNVAPSS
jgi:hypothetical protein